MPFAGVLAVLALTLSTQLANPGGVVVSPDKSDTQSGASAVAKEDQNRTNTIANKHDQKDKQRIMVDVRRDAWDYLQIISTFLFALALVVIGILQARAMYWTYTADHRPHLSVVHLALIVPDNIGDLLHTDPATGVTGLVPMHVAYTLLESGWKQNQNY
jgi:hypothetical protein